MTNPVIETPLSTELVGVWFFFKDTRRDHNPNLTLPNFGLGAPEKKPKQRNISKQRDFLYRLPLVVQLQSTDDEGLSILDRDPGANVTGIYHRKAGGPHPGDIADS